MDLQSDFLKDDIKNTLSQLTQHIFQLQNNSDLIYCSVEQKLSFFLSSMTWNTSTSFSWFFGW